MTSLRMAELSVVECIDDRVNAAGREYALGHFNREGLSGGYRTTLKRRDKKILAVTNNIKASLF
ncbi:MAG: hypothetical protein COC22_00530 [Flavobacteriaceae bacterium]|nr:MAG: hypothetical protein COC22_00530 [Flavobacteriaceae bacterium]